MLDVRADMAPMEESLKTAIQDVRAAGVGFGVGVGDGRGGLIRGGVAAGVTAHVDGGLGGVRGNSLSGRGRGWAAADEDEPDYGPDP